MPNVGAPELILILVVALLVLGPKRLPEAGRGLGNGMREFKRAISSSPEDRPEAGGHTGSPDH